METYWWFPHMFAWMLIFPLSFLIVCLFFLFAFIARGPRWIGNRMDRRYAGDE